ncbi:hypothetical protein ACIQMV_19445 [Streptomyces sp. NPDC091412]|uniref:hypothetical protein n=1 Tax=Streptomyces sp. NPDC091412 TaxID=3366002 RepID=UPI00381DD6C4
MSTTLAAPPPGARLYHGGFPGLRPGDLIEPHPPAVVDGCRICEARAAGEDPIVPGLGVVDPATRHPDRVYVTSDREYGRFHASKVWLGDLYQVGPVGDLVASTEDHWPTWTCQAARVVAVVSRAVRLTDRQRRTLLNKWERRDEAAALARLAGGRQTG